MLNTKAFVLKKINVSFIVHFSLGKIQISVFQFFFFRISYSEH